jgi:hypothetical protein
MSKKAAVAIELAKLLLLRTAFSFSGCPAGAVGSYQGIALACRASYQGIALAIP